MSANSKRTATGAFQEPANSGARVYKSYSELFPKESNKPSESLTFGLACKKLLKFIAYALWVVIIFLIAKAAIGMIIVSIMY